MEVAPRRSRLEVDYDVLAAVRDETRERGTAGLTRVKNKANLPWGKFMKLIEDLAQNGLIQIERTGGHQELELTDKGQGYIRDCENIVKFMRRFALDSET